MSTAATPASNSLAEPGEVADSVASGAPAPGPPAAPEPPGSPADSTSQRLTAIDGLRGVAIALVVLGHGAVTLWPIDRIDSIPVLRGFFHGGAVEIFFIVGGFIVTRTLLREEATGILDPVRFYLRRLVRLGVQLVPLGIVILVVHNLDATDAPTDSGTTWSIVHMLTHTLNIWSNAHIFEARPDLGHLWYLSVQQQVYLVLPLLLVLLLPVRRVLIAMLVLGVIAISVWRMHVLDTAGWLVASTSTTTRADGLLLGVLAAVTLSWWRRHERFSGALATLSGSALVGLVAVVQELPLFSYLRTWGMAFNVVATLLLIGLVTASRPSVVARILSAPPLAYLGRASLAIFVWHLPIFTFVSRHTGGQTWQLRTALAFASLAIVVAVTYRWIEEPTRLWLRANLSPKPVATPAARPEGAGA